MIKSHQTKVTSGDKKHFAECKHVTETKITSQDPLIYFFSFVSLLFFFCRYCCYDYPIRQNFQGPLTMLRLIKVNKYTNK